MIDRIVSMVLAVSVIIFVSVLVMTSVFQSSSSEQALNLQAYERDYGELMLHSVLLSYENNSEMTHESLLIKALQSFSSLVTINDKQIDIEEEFSEVFDGLLGPNNYYISIKPALQGIRVSYVLDGSTTMDGPRQFIANELPGLISDLEAVFDEDANLYFYVYLLDNPNNDGCAIFNNPNINCVYLYAEPFYEDLQAMQYDPPFKPPSPEGFASYEQWLIGNHHAKTYHMTTSDWASGVAYASLDYHRNMMQTSATNGHIIVTIADEMTTSSKADECFTLDKQNDYALCILCDDNCPVERAEKMINQSRDILVNNGDRFIGFHTFPEGGAFCNLEYGSGYTNIAISEYICQYIPENEDCPWTDCDTSLPPNPELTCVRFPETPSCECYERDVGPPAESNFCESNPACGACVPPEAGDVTPPPPDDVSCIDDPGGCYCYLQGCNQYTYDGLATLAAATQGDLLQLQYDNLSQLTNIINQYVTDQIASYDFTLGTQQPERDRYVLEEDVRLLDGESIEILFWMYD